MRKKPKSCRTPFGNFIRERRLKFGLSQTEVAERMGAVSTRVRISAMEKGKSRPGKKFFERIVRALAIDPVQAEELWRELELESIKCRKRPFRNGQNHSLGSFLALSRIKKGMKQKRLAEMCGVSHAFISTIENDRYIPTAGMLRQICEALGCNIPTDLRPSKADIAKIGDLIRLIRLKHDFSERTMADRVGVAEADIYLIESGRRNLSQAEAEQLAAFLGKLG